MLYKRPDSKFWWFQIRFKGKLYQKSTKLTNKQLAGHAEAKFRTDLATGVFGFKLARNAPLLSQFIENDFLPFVNSNIEKVKTLTFYRYHAGVLKESSLGSVPLDVIDEKLIATFSAERRAAGMSIATCNRDRQVLRRIFNLAMKWRKVTAVLARVEMIKGEHQRERVVSPAEESKYLKACEPRLRDAHTIIFDCGLRPEECFRLTPDNVQEDFLVVFYGKGRGSRRRIPMSDRVQRIVARLAKVAVSWFFPADTKSGHITSDTLKKAHRRAIKASGVAFFTPYSIRHTCITRWSRKVDAYTLHYLAGHTDWKTTARYVHIDDERLKGIL